MSEAPGRTTSPGARATSGDRKMINLALQGGGAHGAFTWGVLDRLLEDGRIGIEAISGTSAGAMNAVVLADGYMKGGADGAREALRRFWHAISEASHASPFKRTPIDMFMGNWSLDTSPGFMFFDLLHRLASPYELNPLNINPLREVLEEQVDFEAVRGCTAIRLFVSATNVETGRVRVFDCPSMTVDSVLASACIPLIFQAVEIDGVPYWDGGYMGNPVLFPFFDCCSSSDIMIVQINPIERKGVPKSAREILNRINEITFNSSLLREFRAINFVTRLIDQDVLSEDDYKRVLIHRVHADPHLKPLGASSKLNAEWDFLTHLFEIGRESAAAWLDANFDRLGVESTVDIRKLFQDR